MGQSDGSKEVNPHGECLLCGEPACVTIDIRDGKTIDVCSRHWKMWNHRLVSDVGDGLNSSQLRIMMNEENN